MTSKLDLERLKELRAKASESYELRWLKAGPLLYDNKGFCIADFNFETGDDADFILRWLEAFPAVVARLEAADEVCLEAAHRT